MKNFFIKISLCFAVLALPYYMGAISHAEVSVVVPPAEDNDESEAPAAEAIPVTPSEDTSEKAEAATPPVPVKPVRAPRRADRADAFVAGADWEFDGFVAGGQDSNVRSMFYLNDLLYLNLGSQQGLATGDKVGIYKRGDRIRDPQTGKFIGYEVRRAAIARVTDRVDDDTSAVRIANTYEAVEIGDLVRKE